MLSRIIMNQNNSSNLTRKDFEEAINLHKSYIDISLDDLMTVYERAKILAYRRNIEELPIKYFMTKPVISVKPNFTLKQAAELLEKQKVSGLPVTNEANKLVGYISESDFIQAMGIPIKQTSHTMWDTLESIFNGIPDIVKPTASVQDIMTSKIISAKETQSMHDLIEVMKKNNVRRVVVCDENEYVTGIIAQSDLIRLFFREFL